MKDPKGKTRLILAISKEGEPGLKFMDEWEQSRVILWSQSSGTQGLRIFDARNQLLFSAP